MDAQKNIVPAIVGVASFLMLYSSGVLNIHVGFVGTEVSLDAVLSLAFAAVVALVLRGSIKADNEIIKELR